jgi:tetratricopeptide (TPR) repeat protein
MRLLLLFFMVLFLHFFVLAAEKIDRVSIEKLITKSRLYQSHNSDSALFFANKAFAKAKQGKLLTLVNKASFEIATAYQSKFKFQEALDIFIPLQLELVQSQNRDSVLELKLYLDIAECYRDQHKTVKALEYLFLVTNRLEKYKPTKSSDYMLAHAYTAIAICHGKSDRHEQASVYILKSIAIFNLYDDKEKLINGYNNIGYTYFRLGKYKDAEENLLKGFLIDNTDGSINESLSELYQEIGNADKALLHAAHAYNEARKAKLDGFMDFRKNLILKNLNVQEKIESKSIISPDTVPHKKENLNASKTVNNNTETNYWVYIVVLLALSNIGLIILYFKNTK